MRKLLLVLFVVFGSGTFVQSQKIFQISERLAWYVGNNLIDSGIQEDNTLTFENSSFDIQSKSHLRYVKKILLPSDGYVDAKIEVRKSRKDFRNDFLPVSNLAKDIQVEVLQEGAQFVAFISFIPVVQNGDRNELIEEFDLIIRFSPRVGNTYRVEPYKQNSILKDGEIYKIAVAQSGVHKIDKAFLTSSLNIPDENLSTDRIKIYGARGGRVPEPIEISRIDDLEEIPYLLVGGADGSFDPDDYIIFYAEGADTYKIVDGVKVFEKNIYDFNNYYFLKIDGDSRRRIPLQQQGDRQQKLITSREDYQRIEQDKINLLGSFGSAQGSGKDWYGDIFSVTRTREYGNQFDFNQMVEGSDIHFESKFAGRSSASHSVRFNLGGNSYNETIAAVNISNIEARYARIVHMKTTFTPPDNNPEIGIEYPANGNNEGWLDFIELVIKKNNKYLGKPLLILNSESVENTKSSYQISSISSPIVWDITDPINITSISTSMKDGAQEFHVVNNGELREYIAFQQGDITLQPQAIGKIPNQNLHALSEGELVIIYHPDFTSAVERLSEHRKGQGMNVLTLNAESVFNEFASGKRDPVAIRDFSRMLFTRSNNYKYLLLFGDGSYDYKSLVPGLPDNNFVPVYETNESLHPIEAFPSDDFFALLSDFEGDDLRGQLEIAVGRIPVKTAEEAEIVVEKIIRYETDPETFGDWRLRIGFTADDEDSNTHLNQAEGIARDTEQKFGLFNQQKVYFDAFNQESTPGGARYPDASKALNDNLFKGQLVLNYLGHGGPKGWAQERVLKVNDILSWRNFYKLPLIITATCSFTGYDDPGLVSAGEYALLSSKGGAIALMTTVRAVYSLENERLTAAVFDTIFSSENDINLTIGEIIQRAKNNNWQDTSRINARKFALVGDPSMKLSIPKHNVITTHLNETPIAGLADTLRALQRVRISGIIADRSGNKINDYNGTIFPTIYDKKSKLLTLRNDSRSRVQEFELHKSVLFKGAASIRNGDFSFEFIMPKDIDYRYGAGRISYYGVESNQQSDAAGSYASFIVGGTDTTNIDDFSGPDIRLYMNDENFAYGGITDRNPILLVKLFDENGINVTGNSIGHDLVAVLDGDEKNSYLLNDFYESDVDDFRNGTIRFPLEELDPGSHTLSVKAWDIANNSSEAIIEFNVVSDDDQQISNVYNFPNPFSNNTEFMFEHTLKGGDLGVNIFIYTLSGKVVKIIEEDVISDGYRVNQIFWDGKDDFGDKLGKGIYLYKIKVKDREFNVSKESDFQKLVLLN